MSREADMMGSMDFAAGVAVTLTVSVLVVRYMNSPLRKVLHELCGNPQRSDFWAAFSNVTVGLVPLIFAMGYEPDGNGRFSLVQVGEQLKWGLIGLVSSVLMLGWILSRFIPRGTDPNGR
jgi:hypothetical protein